MFLSYGRQSIGKDDIEAVLKVLRSPYLTQGPTIEAFEAALCKKTGAKYCVVVANATAGLHLAVAALDIAKPATGITSSISFVASSNCLVYNGIHPLFVDIDAADANICIEAIKKNIRRDTRVIIPVHFAGKPADMKAIASIARKHRCFVIEDAAHAIGSRYPSGEKVGSCTYSDMTVFSFHPVKTITTAEGGAITTNDRKLYEKLKILRSHGVTRDEAKLTKNPGPWYYEMQDLGFNYRLTDIQAALGISQLRKLDSFAKRRREIIVKYNKAFFNIDWLKSICFDVKNSVYHLYVILIDFKHLDKDRRVFMENLKQKGIGSQVHYIPIPNQPFYQKTFKTRQEDYPVAQNYYQQCLSLPLFPSMSDKDVDRVIKAVKAEGNNVVR